VIAAGIAYAMRDRIKEVARAWRTGKVYRYHAQRTSSCRAPGRGVISRDVVVRAREWCSQATRTLPDPLNPESGASLPATLVEYVQKGVEVCPAWLAATGAHSIRHVFRYDLSPLFAQLPDEKILLPIPKRLSSSAGPAQYRTPEAR
jgi:hypothetical protein